MNLRSLGTSTVLIALMAVASPAAHAVSFTTSGTIVKPLPGNFDLNLFGVTAGHSAKFANPAGSGLGISGPARLTFTYLGKEAAYNNTFEFDGITRFTNASGGSPFTVIQAAAASLLDFAFTSNGSAQLKNGHGAVSNASIALVMLSATKYLLLFNDNATVDADFDDMGVLVEASPVQLPAALPLLAGGLGFLGAISWSRKRRVL